MSGLSVTNASSPTAWRTVLFETQFGRVWQLRLCVIAVVFTLVASGLAKDQVRRTLIFVLWLLNIVLLVSLVWIGHAAAASAKPLDVLGDAVHLLRSGRVAQRTVATGNFSKVYERLVFVRQTGRSSAGAVFHSQRVLCRRARPCGISNSWLLVGSIHALFTTPYGRLLLFKLTLFAILVGLGARNRSLVKAKLLKARANPACDLNFAAMSSAKSVWALRWWRSSRVWA